MGNAAESQIAELVFVQVLEDRHFGEVQIYRSQEGLFIMKVCRTVISGDKRHQQQLQLTEDLRGVASIIPIVHLRRTEEKGICIKYEKIEVYTEYYNYTLADLMGSKRELEEAELWLILDWLLGLVAELKLRQIGATLRLDTIFLTPAGAPCIYHYHLHSCKESINYSELTMGQSIGKILMQLALGVQLKQGTEEELLQEKQLFGKLAAKYKLLSNFIRQLITGTAEEQALMEELLALREDELIHVAKEVKLLKFKYQLPENPQFLNIPTLSKTPSSASSKLSNKENAPAYSHPLGKSVTKRNPNPHAVSQQDYSRKILLTEQSNTKQRRISEISSSSVYNHSSTKKQPAPLSTPTLSKQQMVKTKEEASKMLGDLDRKKEEYRLQKERFDQRKEELIRAGKENLGVAHQRKSQRRKQEERRVTQQSRSGKYR